MKANRLPGVLRSAILACALAVALPCALPAQTDEQVMASHGIDVVEKFFSGKFEDVRGSFTDEMSKALPPEVVSGLPMQITAQLGAFKGTGTPSVNADSDSIRTVLVPLQFEKGRLIARVAYMLDGSSAKVAGFWIQEEQQPGQQGQAQANEGAEGQAAAAPGQQPGGQQIELPTSGAPYVDATKFKEFPLQVDGLPGVLTLPMEAQPSNPVPVVVLVHGSGPNDMNETVAANRPFLDLAQGLGSQGIAVLRYTKRTLYDPKMGMNKQLTVQEEVVNDVLSALRDVRGVPGLDQTKTFVVGHSLGAWLGPEIAKQDGQLAGIVMLGAPTKLGPQSVIEQIDYLLKNSPDMAAPDKQQAVAAMRAEMEKLIAGQGNPDTPYMGAYMAYWNDLSQRDMVAVAKGLTVPMYLAFGERDYQVLPSNAEGWKAAFESRKDVRVKVYPTLNHLMIAGSGTPLPAEYSIPGYVAPDIVDDIAKFIKAQKPAGLQF